MIRSPQRAGLRGLCRLLGVVCLIGTLMLAAAALPAHAQVSSDVRSMDNAPSVRLADAPTNLFATIEPDEPVDGFLLDLPRAWTLDAVAVLRYGSERVPVEVQSATSASGDAVIRADRPLRGPHDVILRVTTGRGTGPVQWSLTPFATGGDGRQIQSSLRAKRTVRVERAEEPDPDNAALRFRAPAAPLLVSDAGLPALDGSAPFTVEFWMQSTALNTIVLSTWTGQESQPYPLEVVVDASGHLRAYTGRPNEHRVLLSRMPVADGTWHHVAVVHGPAPGRLRLFLNGSPVDSLDGISLASPLRAPRLSLGGRLGSRGQSASAQFEGWIDELRVWSMARSSRDLRRSMHRPSARLAPTTASTDASTSDRSEPRFFQLEAEGGRVQDRTASSLPDGVERVASTLRFRTPLQDLQAKTTERTVQLQWRGRTEDVEAFVVERSTDGRSFSETTTIRPDPTRPPSDDGTIPFSFVDEEVSGQVAYYRIRQVYADDTERLSGTLKVGLGQEGSASRSAELIGNFPNPFTDVTTVTFEVHESTDVTLTVWDLTGQRVARLADGRYGPGLYELSFDAGSRPSGTYFVRLQTQQGTQSHRMVLLK